MASTKLTRTNSTSGNRQIFTVSAWVKLSVTTSGGCIFSTGTAASDTGAFRILHIGASNFQIRSGATVFRTTSAVYRDTSAWYHIVVAQDSTQATADDRLKLYVNGSQVTDFSANNAVPLNLNGPVNESGKIHTIGVRSDSGTDYWNGYMADFYLIDGQQLQASDFGQTDSTGIWKPKGYSGTYGTNGFYLKFSNSGDLGADSSGNGNNFTKSGNGRQRTDTPDNVFATLTIMYNPVNTTGGTSFSEGNLKFTTGTGSARDMDKTAISNIPVNSGKWYCEVKLGSEGQERIGVGPHQGMTINGGNNNRYAYIENDGDRLVQDGTGEVNTTFMGNPSNGDIMMLALDMDNKRLYAGTNGLWSNGSGGTDQSSPNAYLDLNTGTMLTNDTDLKGYAVFQFTSHDSLTNQSYQVNFGNPTFSITSGNTDDNGYGNFEYAPPTGYLALCTKNLASVAAPTIDDGSQYFKTVTYTGNAPSSQTITTGLRPDIVWTKNRTNIADHNLYDTNRGDGLKIKPNQAEAEADVGTDFQFGTTGFTVGNRSETNDGSAAMVSWNWNVNNGSTSSNTDGSITSTVQVNTTVGMSIVTYTGTGSNATVGHGLGKVPDVVIVKRRTNGGSYDWGVQMNNALGFYNALRLNLTNAYGGANGAGWWNDTASTTTTVSLGTRTEVNAGSQTYVMYCFNNVEGYSKFGKYTGNGNTDGTFVYTGFRPAFVLTKRTDSVGQWYLKDTKRSSSSGFNTVGTYLKPNSSDAEGTNDSAEATDILSNGFKQRNTEGNMNASGATYIYMAFAENPFVTSGGLPVTAR